MPEPMHFPPGNREESASVRGKRVVRVRGAQWGAIGRLQLRDCGVDKDATSRWVRTGRLHRHPQYRGVYTVGHANLPVEGELTRRCSPPAPAPRSATPPQRGGGG